MLTLLQKASGRVVSDCLARVSNGCKNGRAEFLSEKFSELNNLSGVRVFTGSIDKEFAIQ